MLYVKKMFKKSTQLTQDTLKCGIITVNVLTR